MIFFDEAGNSGGNLLDTNQPTYLLLSHNFTIGETYEILKPLRESSKAKELHFIKIKKYRRLQIELIKCLNHPLITHQRICYYVAHKRFMIAIQMVDQLIEPVLYDNGIDIYQYGTNLSTANILHILGTVIWDKSGYDLICERFVNFIREANPKNCYLFYNSVSVFRDQLTPEDGMILDLIMWSYKHLDTIVPSLDKYSLDATLSCFNSHCQFWAKVYNKPFDIVFDQSKQIDYWRNLIDFLTLHLPEQEVGYGSRKYKYPLLINELKLDDSLNNPQLQLSDIFASSLNYMFTNWARGNDEDEFLKEINQSKLHQIATELKMWPSEEVTPESLDMVDGIGVNPLDFIAKIAAEKPNEYNKVFKN